MSVRLLAAALAGLALAGAAASPGVAVPRAHAAVTVASPSSFQALVGDLGPLETYARQYAGSHPGTSVDGLLLVYLRTANPAYDDSRWAALGGERDPAFESYVEDQDGQNDTSAADLKRLRAVTLPNGEVTDAVHMFATMNLGTPPGTAAADLGGFAGDITDLMTDIAAVTGGPAAVQAAAAADFRNPAGGFSDEDLRADLDAVNLVALRSAHPQTPYADLLTTYFTGLTDRNRVDGFLTNRFPSTPRTSADLRAAVLNAYTSNAYISVLEYRRGISSLSDQRTAAVTVFADHLADAVRVIPVAITSPAAASVVTTATPAIAGTGQPGATVTLTGAEDHVLGTTTVGADGAWSVTAATLPAGRAALTATQSGLGGAATTAMVDVDVVLPPAIPAVSPWIAVAIASGVAVALLSGLLIWWLRRSRGVAASRVP